MLSLYVGVSSLPDSVDTHACSMSLQSGQLKGALAARGRTRVYMPDSFVAEQHEAAHAFFTANGYLDHATASELQVR